MLERVKFKSAAQRAAAAPAFDKEQSAAAAGAAQARGRRLSHGSGQLLPSGTGLSPRPAGSRGAAGGLSPPPNGGDTPEPRAGHRNSREEPHPELGWAGQDEDEERREMWPGCSCSSPGSRLVTGTFHGGRGLSPAVQGRARSVGIRAAGRETLEGPSERCGASQVCPSIPPSREQIPASTPGTLWAPKGASQQRDSAFPFPALVPIPNPRWLGVNQGTAKGPGAVTAPCQLWKFPSPALLPRERLGHCSWSNGKQKPRQQKSKRRRGTDDGCCLKERVLQTQGAAPNPLHAHGIIYSSSPRTDRGLGRDTIDRSRSESTKKGNPGRRAGLGREGGRSSSGALQSWP